MRRILRRIAHNQVDKLGDTLLADPFVVDSCKSLSVNMISP
jgi:hypothetical protein